jgi:hypothetical protein
MAVKTLGGQDMETLFDRKRLMELLTREEQEDGTIIFRAKPLWSGAEEKT